MKTLTTLLSLSLLALSTASFAGSDGNKSEEKSKVPVAPSVWESPEIEAPESLKFLKAKNAFVPVATFAWGDPAEAPETLLIVPVAPFAYGDPREEAPKELDLIKVKSVDVPLAPFVWGDATEVPGELSVE